MNYTQAPGWMCLTEEDDSLRMVQIKSIKSYKRAPNGGCLIYCDSQPYSVKEDFDHIYELIVGHEAGGYSVR